MKIYSNAMATGRLYSIISWHDCRAERIAARHRGAYKYFSTLFMLICKR